MPFPSPNRLVGKVIENGVGIVLAVCHGFNQFVYQIGFLLSGGDFVHVQVHGFYDERRRETRPLWMLFDLLVHVLAFPSARELGPSSLSFIYLVFFPYVKPFSKKKAKTLMLKVRTARHQVADLIGKYGWQVQHRLVTELARWPTVDKPCSEDLCKWENLDVLEDLSHGLLLDSHSQLGSEEQPERDQGCSLFIPGGQNIAQPK